MRAEAAEEPETEEAANSSGEIGPAPTSQFIEVEPVKEILPCQPSLQKDLPNFDLAMGRKLCPTSSSVQHPQLESILNENATSPANGDRQPLRQQNRSLSIPPKLEPTDTENRSQEIAGDNSRQYDRSFQRSGAADVLQVLPKGKRKLDMRDEEPSTAVRTTNILTEKSAPMKLGKVNKKPIKNAGSLRAKAKQLSSVEVDGTSERKILGIKSSNRDLTSPQKTSKIAPLDEVSMAKADALRGISHKKSQPETRHSTTAKLEITPVLISSSTKPAVSNIQPEMLKSTIDSVSIHPLSPEPLALGESHDTPPPADINSRGEAARPSRRARSQVSYTEPNLRDKMRRPSKQLVSAVAGEGKYHRSSIKADEFHPSVISSSISSAKAENACTSNPVAVFKPGGETQREERQAEIDQSPLSKKSSKNESQPSTNEDHQENCLMTTGQGSDIRSPELNSLHSWSHEKNNELPAPAEPEVQGADPYEFTPSSPSNSSTEQCSLLSTSSSSLEESVHSSSPTRSRGKPRRASAMKIDYSEMDEDDDWKPQRGVGKKRSSMAMPKRRRDEEEFSSSETISGSDNGRNYNASRGHAVRRKSMMV